MYRKLLKVLIIIVLTSSCIQRIQRNSNQKIGHITGELLFSDDFSGDLANWISEGAQPAIIEGQMDLNTPAGTTVWFKPELQGDIMIEYDAVVIAKGGQNDRVSDLNCFWMATDPLYLDNLFASGNERNGILARYDNLNLYYVGYGGNTNTTTRFRRYNNGDRKLLGELTDKPHLIEPNHQYHIQLVCFGNIVEYFRDGERLFSYLDPEPYRRGHFGLRTTQNHLVMDNFKVSRILTNSAKL